MNAHYEWDGSSWVNSGTLPINFYSGSVVVCKNEIHLMGGYGGKTAHYLIREGQGKKIIIGLPKGTKILTQYSIDNMYGFTNCVKDGDYLVATGNGVVEFLIDTEAESAKLTLMY